MRDFGEYLRAYWAYVSTNLGWGKALMVALVWLAGMFAPLGAKTLVQLPNWVAITWMIGWALLGYIFAPYGMWKEQCPLWVKSRQCAAQKGMSALPPKADVNCHVTTSELYPLARYDQARVAADHSAVF